jgi:hypothetical protein
MIPPQSRSVNGSAPASRSVRGRVSLGAVHDGGRPASWTWLARRTAQIGSGEWTPRRRRGSTQAWRTSRARIERELNSLAPEGSAQYPLRVRDADVTKRASDLVASELSEQLVSEAAGALETRTRRIASARQERLIRVFGFSCASSQKPRLSGHLGGLWAGFWCRPARGEYDVRSIPVTDLLSSSRGAFTSARRSSPVSGAAEWQIAIPGCLNPQLPLDVRGTRRRPRAGASDPIQQASLARLLSVVVLL